MNRIFYYNSLLILSILSIPVNWLLLKIFKQYFGTAIPILWTPVLHNTVFIILVLWVLWAILDSHSDTLDTC